MVDPSYPLLMVKFVSTWGGQPFNVVTLAGGTSGPLLRGAQSGLTFNQPRPQSGSGLFFVTIPPCSLHEAELISP